MMHFAVLKSLKVRKPSQAQQQDSQPSQATSTVASQV